jgi:hypothetical protein
MKMRKLVKVSLASLAPSVIILFLVNSFLASAQTKKIVDCQQGNCIETYISSKRVIRQYQLSGDKRTIYLVDLKTSSGGKTVQSQDWVQCSTSQPFVAFIPSPGLPQESTPRDLVFIHYINPGEKFMANYQRNSHRIYWAVCHNVWRDNVYEMGGVAKSLGYSLKLQSDQREVPRATFKP